MLAAKGSKYCGEHLIHDNALVYNIKIIMNDYIKIDCLNIIWLENVIILIIIDALLFICLYVFQVLSESKSSSQLRRRIPCPLDSTHTVFEDTLHKHLKKCNAAKKPKPSCYSAYINTGLIDYQPSDEEKLPLSAFSTERIDELVKKVELAYQGLSHC